MTLFKKNQTSQPQLSLFELNNAFRQRVYDAIKESGVNRLNTAAVLEDIARNERLAHAYTAPLPGATPKLSSANVAPGPIDKLHDLIATSIGAREMAYGEEVSQKSSIRDLARRIAGV